MRYHLLYRLRRIHELRFAVIHDDGLTGEREMEEPGYYLEFDGPCLNGSDSNILFTRSDDTDSVYNRPVARVPERADVIARRVCPCIMEWEHPDDYKSAQNLVPEISHIFYEPALRRVVFEPTNVNGQDSSRFWQRAIDVRKFLEENCYLDTLLTWEPSRPEAFRPRYVLDDWGEDVRVLLKLKFTKALVDQ